MAQRLKRLPPMRETRVPSLGWEDPLEKEMVTHSSVLAWRNINNLRYADDILMAENKEELKSLLMKVKEERERAGLKLNI